MTSTPRNESVVSLGICARYASGYKASHVSSLSMMFRRSFLRVGFALSLWLSLVSASALAADEPTRASVQALVERQARCWETGDEAEFLATLHPNSVFAYPGKRLARDGALKMFRDWKRDFRNTRLKVHRLVIDGRNFSVEYLFVTTNAATGKRTASGTNAVGEVKDGKILVWKEYLDGRVSRQQAAGELPIDENAEPFPWPDTPQSRQP